MAAAHVGRPGQDGGPAPPGEGRSEAGGPGAPRSAPRVAPSPGSSYPGGGGRGAGRRRAGPAGSAEGGAAPLLCVTHPARAAASSILWRWRRAGKASGHLFTRAPAAFPSTASAAAPRRSSHGPAPLPAGRKERLPGAFCPTPVRTRRSPHLSPDWGCAHGNRGGRCAAIPPPRASLPVRPSAPVPAGSPGRSLPSTLTTPQLGAGRASGVSAPRRGPAQPCGRASPLRRRRQTRSKKDRQRARRPLYTLAGGGASGTRHRSRRPRSPARARSAPSPTGAVRDTSGPSGTRPGPTAGSGARGPFQPRDVLRGSAGKGEVLLPRWDGERAGGRGRLVREEAGRQGPAPAPCGARPLGPGHRERQAWRHGRARRRRQLKEVPGEQPPAS